MKAVHWSQYGAPNKLKIVDRAIPIPGKKQLLVKVMASTVNRTDCAMLYARPLIMRLISGLTKPSNPTLGTDFAGIVEEVGEDVRNFKIGDKVFGFNDMGLQSHAEYLCINETEAVLGMATNQTFEQAAASIEGLHYAENIINKVKLSAGEKALVIGGTGAIGSACIQLLKTHQVQVDAVCKGIHADEVKELGANKIYDYTSEDVTTSGQQYHYVFDCVGKSSFGACKPILLDKGTYISSELGPGNENLYLPLKSKIMGGKRVKFPFPSNRPYSLNLAKQLSEKGEFTPMIDRTFKLDEIVEAFIYVESGDKKGNVVLKTQTE